ncbi:DUF1120 domain-containing protein [Pseudomonas coleopterorum]|jgi:hypothetical protein|uniref:DUF1120 domain-containing protein n=1 Tax=Pseudomonas coleopterorum TaxID=1605838 RepID=A0ABR9C266_9PSED|nr:DUF1120 domain-containing protein [Pseudomonas coleopterorum]MBD8755793.1 DUF1120 domain-containing protein [Pseudomonas coleopterorum]MBD8771445.1 DUF1120 domain-containing protein [Pseudomonas coleopterorum]
MNLSSRLLTGAALLVALPAAMAASTVDMTVTGSIVPAACTPTLSIADFNHGKISKADLNTDKPTIIPTGKWGTLSVSCTAPTVYAIRGTDNRADTVAHYNMYVGPYGLGLTPAGEKLGAHYLDVHPTKSLIDGKPTFVSVGDAAGSRWSNAASANRAIRNNGELLGFHDTAGPITQPLAIKDATFSLLSTLVMAPAKGLTLTDEVALDGAATIEVVYL